jgi:hypothetical protein
MVTLVEDHVSQKKEGGPEEDDNLNDRVNDDMPPLNIDLDEQPIEVHVQEEDDQDENLLRDKANQLEF